jgi:hypothetical protein
VLECHYLSALYPLFEMGVALLIGTVCLLLLNQLHYLLPHTGTRVRWMMEAILKNGNTQVRACGQLVFYESIMFAHSPPADSLCAVLNPWCAPQFLNPCVHILYLKNAGQPHACRLLPKSLDMLAGAKCRECGMWLMQHLQCSTHWFPNSLFNVSAMKESLNAGQNTFCPIKHLFYCTTCA